FRIGPYHIPARPPLVNVVHSFVMAHFGTSFAVYQTAHSILSALVFLPLALFAMDWGKGRRSVWPLALVLALNPMFVENAVFTWTKAPTSFFLLLSIWFYVQWLR